MIRNIFRLAWQHAWRKPFQSTFFIIGVALGVAIILAIDLANESVKRAFMYSAESIAGKTTHRIVGHCEMSHIHLITSKRGRTV